MRRKIFVFATALAAFAMVAGSAWAVKRPVTFMTSGQLKKACNDNGGSFYQNSGGNYSCSKDCTGKNGTPSGCTVNCNGKSKKCEGHTPDRQAGGSIQQILRAGTFSDRRNVKTMINNSGDFTQQPAGTRMINNSGTFQAGQPGAVGVPTTGVPNLAIPARAAPAQGNLNMQKR
jgi:hypothetical protein